MSIWAERRGYQNVPYPLGTPEWESFKNYAKAYYKDAVHMVADMEPLLLEKKITTGLLETSIKTILSAVISPLVFLWEKWQIMSLDNKLKYATPEYKEQLEKVKAEAQKVKEQAGTA